MRDKRTPKDVCGEATQIGVLPIFMSFVLTLKNLVVFFNNFPIDLTL